MLFSSPRQYAPAILSSLKLSAEISSAGFAATDYYFLLVDALDCTIAQCNLARKQRPGENAPSHGGHGFVVQADTIVPNRISTGNTVRDSQTESIQDIIELRGHAVANTFEDIDSDVLIEYAGSKRIRGGVTFISCPYGNTFRRIDAQNCLSAVFSCDGWERGDPFAGYCCTGNTFTDCTFEGCKRAAFWNSINLGKTGLVNGNTVTIRTPWKKFSNNSFVDCDFISDGGGFGSGYPDSVMFWSSRESENNILDGCTFVGFDAINGGFLGNQYYEETEGGTTMFGPMPIYTPGFIFQ